MSWCLWIGGFCLWRSIKWLPPGYPKSWIVMALLLDLGGYFSSFNPG
jgi:hypothetical protein